MECFVYNKNIIRSCNDLLNITAKKSLKMGNGVGYSFRLWGGGWPTPSPLHCTTPFGTGGNPIGGEKISLVESLKFTVGGFEPKKNPAEKFWSIEEPWTSESG